jgi:hypothetical protein
MQYSRSRKYLGHLSLTMLQGWILVLFLGIWSNGWSAMGDMVGSNTGWLVDISNIILTFHLPLLESSREATNPYTAHDP